MAYQTRKPPIRIVVNIEQFNKLVELVNRYSKVDDERTSKYAEKMKEKLLRYSVPHTEEDGTETIDIRFFNNEAQDVIYYLMNSLEINVETNYYEVLLKVRKQNKKTEE